VPLPPGNGASTGTLLIDGFWQADWTITRGRDRAELEIRPFVQLPAPVRDDIAAEGSRLLAFAAPATAHDVRFAPLALTREWAGDHRSFGRIKTTPDPGGTVRDLR